MSDLEARLEALEDKEAIRDLQARYAAACDAGYDADAAVELFTDDCVWDGGEAIGRYEGIAAVRDFFAAAGARFTFAVHFMIAPRTTIEAGGNSAAGSWYLLEPCTIDSGGEPEAFWVAAVYDAEYRKGEDGWKFHRLTVDTRLMAPHATGWATDTAA
jgi:ketosteroid isomerase-like protein